MPNAFRSIGLISRATSVIGNRLFRHDDLQNSQFIYLMRIIENPGITQTALADQLHVDPSTCLRTVRKLIAHQYVARQADAHNKKLRPLVATTEGQALYPELQAYEQHIIAIGTHGLTPGEQLILEELLAKVATNVREYQDTQNDD